MNGTTEDYCLGSQYWANNMHKIGYSANFGILLDMVGARGAMFAKEYHSMTHASAYVHHVWNIAKDLGYDNFFNNRPTRHVGIDDHVYVNTVAKIQVLILFSMTRKQDHLHRIGTLTKTIWMLLIKRHSRRWEKLFWPLY